MKKPTQRNSLRSIALLAFMTPVLPLLAADTAEVPWNKLCLETQGHEITMTGATGEPIHGFCTSVTADSMQVRTDHGIVKVAKSTITRMIVEPSKPDQLRKLGKGMHAGLKFGVHALFSPEAIAGIVVIPVTLAWGAASAPFCLLGDLGVRLSEPREIKPI